MAGVNLISSSPRVFHVAIACLVIYIKLTIAVDPIPGHCFRHRIPIGDRGKCQDKIDNISSAEECCLLGGTGWAEKANGKRCTDPCKDQRGEDADALEHVPEMQINREEMMAPEEEIAVEIEKGVWVDWGEWQPCSVSCGEGFIERRRECHSASGQNNSAVQCHGKSVEHMPCGTNITCPVHGQWGEWSDWSECSATCGETMIRYRECDSPVPEHGGENCVGKSSEVDWCNGRKNCPINGGWKRWNAWSPCSVTCGRQGEQSRYRSCSNPLPNYGGLDCDGDSANQRPCGTAVKCPIDGGWSKWGKWRCLPECANGGQGWALRHRLCTEPIPKHGGERCKGSRTERTPCSDIECPVDGGWSEWTSWGDCSSSCGDISFRSRKRSCDNPPPQHGGLPCMDGEKFEIEDCDVGPCTVSSASDVPPCDDEDYSSQEGGSGCQGNGSGDEGSFSPEYVDGP